MSVKQLIVMRTDLQMTKGKMIAQGSHASLGVILGMMDKDQGEEGFDLTLPVDEGTPLYEWLTDAFTKICVRVESEEDLDHIYEQAERAGLPVKLIVDRGLTMFHGIPTKTCLAIGPEESEKIDKITGHLKLL